MATIKKRVDDYLYNSRGEEAQDAQKATISIPGLAFGGTRVRKHDLDLSDKGRRAMVKERDRLEAATIKMWAEFLKNVGFDSGKHAPKAGEETDASDDSADEANDLPDGDADADNESDGDLTDADLEAATKPSGAGH